MKSLLNYARKIRDGVLFSETFENDNFVLAQSWVALQGLARNTAAQARAGIRSLQLNGLGTPILWKALTDTNVENEDVQVWYYDTMDAVLPGPYLKVKLNGGQFFQVGVRNGFSTTHYCANPAGVTIEDVFAVTAAPRSLGWHRFRVVVEASGTVNAWVDGVQVILAEPVPVNSYVTDLKLQADVYGSALDSFGYFDEVRIFRHDRVKVSGVASRSIAFRDPSESLHFFVYDEATDTCNFYPELYALDVYPRTYSLQFSQRRVGPYDVAGWYKLAGRTPDLGLNNGDWYLLEEINFGDRRVSTQDLTPHTLTNRNESTNGRVEFLTYGYKDRYRFTVQALQGRGYWKQAANWFAHARDGSAFGLLVAENDSALAKAASLARAGSSLVLCHPNFPASGHNFVAGNYYVIEKADRSARQTVLVTNVGAGPLLTLDDKLAFDVEPLDWVRSVYFLPFLEIDGQDLGLNLSEPRKERYNWVQSVREYVP